MEHLLVRMVLEILGRPPEHISQALKMIVARLEKEQGVTFKDIHFHEPRLAKDAQNLFTSFVDLTVELDSMHRLWGILFNYMPANIEIISPERLMLRNDELNHAANQLVHRLHDYDAITKNVIAERDIAIKKLQEIAPHLFKKQPSIEPAAEKPKIQKRTKKKKRTSR
ncbi:hypothetical protein HYZ97_04170 [Candidatus Pacearchaeota archaeon]|nr:hypothetical protein [Candidatus Pacearchaeota archaeon]